MVGGYSVLHSHFNTPAGFLSFIDRGGCATSLSRTSPYSVHVRTTVLKHRW